MRHIYFFIILFFASCEKDIYQPQIYFEEYDGALEWEVMPLFVSDLINNGGSFPIDTLYNDTFYIDGDIQYMNLIDDTIKTADSPPAVIPAEGMRKKKY